MDWVSLHHHSTYSFMDGFGTPEKHVERAAELGMTAMALTEHGNTSSHFRFEKAAKGTDVKPIFGIEAYTGPITEEDRAQFKWHLGLLAADIDGYRNLNRLVTQSYRDRYYKPTVGGGVLAEFNKGLYCLSGCAGSLLACTLLGGKGFDPHPADIPATIEVAERFRDLFGERYYLEVQGFPELDRTCAINESYEKISKLTGIPLAATMDCHYPDPDDAEMQVILHAAGRGSQSAEDMERAWNYEVRLTLPESDDAMVAKLVDSGMSRSAARSAVANTAVIGEACNVTLPKAERLRYPGIADANEELWEWLRNGWRYRGLGNRPETEQAWYAEKVRYEMGLYLSKDFADFMLATSDMVQWAKDNGIPVGPGRGSVAASVVAWLLRITEVDPIRYPGMLFERFVDVTRTDPPDIDLDFADDRRYEVRDYLAGKYGADCVGTIGNFVRYRSKNSLQDVGRVHRIPRAAVATVSDLVIERSGGDSRFDDSLADTVAMFPAAREVFERFPDLWKATRLEGNVRGMSIHAAGVVVANSPLTDICAVYEGNDGRQVLSIDKYDAEYAGMLKMDTLGLTTMGVISRALELAGLTLEDLYAIPDNDSETLQVFKRGDVTGVFQFEGRATRLVNRDVAPDSFAEVIDINALSRPGPLFSGTTAEYCDVKHGRKPQSVYHPIVTEITKLTKGCIIYQEQILQIVREVGGFDWTNANDIRRIISKKIGQAAFQVSMGRFQEGAERLHGIDSDTSEAIWKRIVTSGTYAFVYAHATSYSILSLWCAWLKTHYPREFYAAALTRAGSDDSAFKLMRDAEAHGLKIAPPDLTLSGIGWSYADAGLVPGWDSIPGVGEKMAERITSDRAENGEFGSWEDMSRIPGIGPKKVAAMADFANRSDPFNLRFAERTLDTVLSAVEAGRIRVPRPTHDGTALAALDTGSASSSKAGRRGPSVKSKVVWAGIVKNRLYQDAAENDRSRSGDEMEDILKRMKRPDLLKYCVLQSFDATDEEVYVRTNRFTFPRMKRVIESIRLGHDVIIVRGYKSPGFGTSVIAEDIYVIDPD